MDYDYLTGILTYDKDTGFFRWMKTRSRTAMVNEVAGTLKDNGYLQIQINRKAYYAHRLAWFYVNREWPPHDVDHVNGCRTDNRIENLRCATRKQNTFNSSIRSNNTSGVKGVSWNKRKNKWEAYCAKDGKRRNIGLFDCIEEARKSVEKERMSLHGVFYNNG